MAWLFISGLKYSRYASSNSSFSHHASRFLVLAEFSSFTFTGMLFENGTNICLNSSNCLPEEIHEVYQFCSLLFLFSKNRQAIHSRSWLFTFRDVAVCCKSS